MSQKGGLLPEKEEDYIPFFRWMVGRKAAYLAVILFIISSIFVLLLCSVCSLPDMGKASYRRFAYDSVILKFYKGKAEIVDSDGDIVYRGKVTGGTANGRGTLYAKTGRTVYEGNFVNGKYEGQGTLYAPGKREVFHGNFRRNRIIYEELVGRPVSETAESYKGKREIYQYADCVCTVMPEIEAAYYAVREEESLEEEWTAAGVYVLKPEFADGDDLIDSWSGLEMYFGKAAVSGTEAAKFQNVVAVRLKKTAQGEAVTDSMMFQEMLRNVYMVTAFQPERELKIHTYEKDGFRYTFFGEKGDEGFMLYLIERKEE